MAASSEVSIKEAIGLARGGETAAAVAALRAILEEDPHNLKALLALGAFTPNVAEGVIALELALELDPESDAARRALAELRARLRERRASTSDAVSPASDEAEDEGGPGNAPAVLGARAEGRAIPHGQGLRVVEGSQSLPEHEAKKYRQRTVLGWLLLGLLLVAAVAGLVPLGGWILGVGTLSPMWILSGLVLEGVVWLALPGVGHLRDEWKNFRGGRLGEEKLAAVLQRQLSQDWALFLNVVLPQGSCDIDAVLVGPRGVFALEVKAYSGYYRNVGRTWRRRAYGRWHTLDCNPTRQARRNAAALSKYLERCGTDVWVKARIVWAGDGRLLLQKPRVRVWQLSHPDSLLEDIEGQEPLPGEVVRGTVRALESVCCPNCS